MTKYELEPIGVIRSPIKKVEDAPLFYTESAPDAHIEVLPKFRDALHGMKSGDEIIVITWLHLGDRRVLRVHPRGNPANPLTGVFSTRSPDRPNPLGLHRVVVRKVEGDVIHIGAMEAIDGTPVVDIKCVVGDAQDS